MSRYESAPFTTLAPNMDTLDTSVSLENNRHSIFSTTYQYAGFLDCRQHKDKPWRRRYFVVNNNFLLCAATPHSTKLEAMIPLEGSKISSHLRSSDMTFELFTRRQRLYFRTAAPKQCASWTKAIQNASQLKIKDIYRFLYELGEGQANIKVVAAKHRTTNEHCAIKIVDKRMCDKKMLRNEIQILKKIDHPQIVSIYDLIETKKYLYVVMEMCVGGELFDRIAELDGDGFSQEDTSLIMHQICSAVKHMNEQGIVHRDLKPENVLCVEAHSVQKIKICDFGISKIVHNLKEQKLHTICGTVSYSAPEVLKRKQAYDYTCDYWSIGVIMFVLLCGYPPFFGDDDREIEYNIIHEEVEFEEEDWDHVSVEVKTLVQGLLNKNPRQRLGPDDVLKLTWKISNQSTSARKSHQRFKQTVLRTKLQRHSLGKYEADSVISRKMFKVFAPAKKDEEEEEEKKESTIDNNNHNKRKSIKRTSRISQKLVSRQVSRSKDDIHSLNDDQHCMQKYERKIDAFRGNRMSKGTEALLELKLPVLSRATNTHLSMIADDAEDDDDDDEDTVSLM